MSSVGWVLVLISAGLVVSGNLLMRAGLDRAGGFSSKLSIIHQSFLSLAQQPLFDLGVILYGLGSIIWLRILSTEPLSLAYPVLISVTFILVNLGAIIFFVEELSFLKILGMTIILIGIFIISRS